MWFLILPLVEALLDAVKPILILIAAIAALQLLGIDVIGMASTYLWGAISPV